MKYWVCKKANALYPADERAERMFKRLFDGEAMQLSLERSRSYKWHKMYVSCCIAIGQNCDPSRDWESIDYELRIRSGHYEVMFVDGHEVRYPKRIAFDKLTADQWAQLWPSLDLAMQEHFGFDHTARRYAA